MPEDWSQFEVEAIVSDYFVMWEMELRGENFNKAEHNRLLRKLLPTRSRGSIEKKHQNISAVLWHLGYPYIDGYKPLPNYQTLLRKVIEERLSQSKAINRLVISRIHETADPNAIVKTTKSIQVDPPRPKEVKELVAEGARKKTRFVRRNYLEMESVNHSLGLAGENFVLQFETQRLWKAGKRSLADKVEHVSQTQGDGLGFDILSFESNGRERLIEVKTTKFGMLSRFFASANEVAVSTQRFQEYHLYRLFNFEKQPQFFVLKGSLKETCDLKAVSYSAIPH